MVGLFAKAKKVPIQVDQRQILYPVGVNQSARDKARTQAKNALDEGRMVFRYLSDQEELVFRSHARTKYVAFSPIEGIWHPVYQDECVRINHEASYYRLPTHTEEQEREEAEKGHRT